MLVFSPSKLSTTVTIIAIVVGLYMWS